MIDIKELYIVNYCHPNCKLLQNIMRLPEKQAFEKAGELARKIPKRMHFTDLRILKTIILVG